MTSGFYIITVCFVGALIGCVAFWWATRADQFSDCAEARFLVFDDDEIAAAQEAERRVERVP